MANPCEEDINKETGFDEVIPETPDFEVENVKVKKKPQKKLRFTPVIVRKRSKKKLKKDKKNEMVMKSPDLFDLDENMDDTFETVKSSFEIKKSEHVLKCEHIDKMIDDNNECQTMTDNIVSDVPPMMSPDNSSFPCSDWSVRINIDEIVKGLITQTNFETNQNTQISETNQNISTTDSNFSLDSLSTDELILIHSETESRINHLFIETEKSS